MCIRDRFRLAEDNIPIEPVTILASSDKISPNIFSVKMTSNCFGSLTSCIAQLSTSCLLYTSEAADEEDSVDLGGRRIIKKKKKEKGKEGGKEGVKHK